MSLFCSQCCGDWGMEADIDLFEIALNLDKGRSESFICEGCNNRAVYKDEKGILYIVREIGREIILIQVQISELMYAGK